MTRQGPQSNMERFHSLSDLFSDLAPFYLWAYNGFMEIVNFQDRQYNAVGARGRCPHCPAESYFRPVGTPHQEQIGETPQHKIVNAAQCEACKGFVLVVGQKPFHNQPAILVNVFPLGKPNDSVDPSVPAAVAEDFKEALRCEWVNAYKACVVMCRRAVQSSVIQLGAKGERLIDQIDDLLKNGKITQALKDFAHEIRLTGNEGAHPDKDALAEVSDKDASDMIEFTKQYLHHVYVMPAKLKARKSPVVASASITPTPR
jgi:hypothetical protein